MGTEKLKFVQDRIVDELHSNVDQNILLYQTGNFEEESKQSGWSIETKGVTYDPEFASELRPTNAPADEISNSLLVFDSLQGMTPALAREERIWVRLCHMDCLDYARARWVKTSNPVRDVRKHFFASRLDQTRDDNAIGRLWWTAHLASMIDPENSERVLNQMLKRANIRLQFVDRANASFRLPLARSIIRLLEREEWLNSHDRAFEHFMLVLDRNSGGLIFESLEDDDIDQFLSDSLPLAKKVHEERVSA
jgi:hypothetical protein